jgi:cytochrome c-type biogenesis protein CcmE
MSALRVKLVAGAVTLIGAIAFLAFAGARDGGWVYFVDVDKFVTDAQLHNQRVRLHGKVGTDGFAANSGKLTAEFKIQGHTQSLPVSYRGSVPDMFQPGRDVVVEGRRDATSGVFQADVLMTKCASKYEPGSPHANRSDLKLAATAAAEGAR